MAEESVPPPDERDGAGRARGVARWQHPAWASAGVLVAYFAFPVEWAGSTAGVVASLLLTVAGLAVVGGAMALELRHVRRGAEMRSGGVLMIMEVALVAAFSLAFYLVELLAPRQFDGLSTRTDALYFTLSTMATVGYGDVHAEGQLARALVCGLIVFSVVVVTSLVRSAAGRPGR
ncbi:ion channel [Nocardioides sp. cx-169]|uniref:potassium channel family protein n=1 Tax=Nocardioides sp. cx-169 TaxID=2899080 RepID=UPI001E434938|nr:potassium channel family protein [Nocardioides sp. cx-169]MCD4535291.1 ion channel [Nocardioides sp. cx-169]